MKNYKIYPNVKLGKNVDIDDYCIIGRPPRGCKPGELEVVIGDHSVIRGFTTIYAGVKIGNNFQTCHVVLIREDNIIGDNVSIGTNSVLEYGNRIGDNSRIHSGCFLELVTIKNNVFVAPNVVFTDDPHPPCPKYKNCVGGVIVKSYAKIGGNSTILPGVIIGKGSLIGGGSVVSKNVPDYCVAIGCPAKIVKKVDDLKCWKKYFKKPYDWEK